MTKSSSFRANSLVVRKPVNHRLLILPVAMLGGGA